mmetsp:Transcript_4880/g.8241  ORF Transcript_4880/g.8241 Transcript_4880/m.8241 type:complete len:153 (+) Transcript_4880:574-1032(+)
MLNAMRTAVLASKTLQFRHAPGCAFENPERTVLQSEASLRYTHDLTHLDALWLATQGGADSIGLGAHLGSFDVGKSFDAVVLRASPTVRPFRGGIAESYDDIIHKILTLGDDRNVAEVYCGGVRLKDDRKAPPSKRKCDELAASGVKKYGDI